MQRWLTSIVAVVLSLTVSGTTRAQLCGQTPDMLIAFDRSWSMTEMVGSKTKYSIATAAVTQLVNSYAGQIRFGLMLYPSKDDSCQAGVINVQVADNNQGAISAALNASYPSGETPIAATLANALTYLNGIDPTHTKYVLLVTDGMENCNGNPVSAVTQLASAKIKTYVVGFGSGVDQTQLNSMASAGGTTSPYKADSPAQLTTAFTTIGGKVSCCGNGVLDAGEACDTAIAPGQAGACPTSCNDGDPCTIDLLSGSSCNTLCVTQPVLTPKNGDGCCPPGADSTNDNDCSASCGNGVLESGETCDPKITTGPGKCKTAADCDDNDPCTADSLGGTACDVTCVNNELGADPTAKDGCCPPQTSVTDDPDCPPACGPDTTENCVDLCKGVTCPDGEFCYSGTCKPWPKNTPAQHDAGGSSASEAGAEQPGTPKVKGEGCSCQSAAGPASPWMLLVLLLLLRRPRR